MNYKGECQSCKTILHGQTEDDLANKFTEHNEEKHSDKEISKGIRLVYLKGD